MQRSGTAKFTDADDYRTNIRGANVDLVFSSQRNFEASLTWVELRHLRLMRGEENLPRVANIALASDLVFIAFPIHHNPPQIFDGVELQPGNIVFHACAERVHQWTRGPSKLGLISLAPQHLAAYGKALAGVELVAPPLARILRPSRLDASRLRSLHAKACRLAETKPKLLAHPEVSRAIEQELLHTLIKCLTSSEVYAFSGPKRHHLHVVAQFEEMLSKHSERQLQLPELCTAIGVSERTLRTCCSEFLGMSPSRYLRLQRLNLVREELRRVYTPTSTISEIARRYGFWELGRFAGIYQAMFGEAPSTTLRFARAKLSRRISAGIA